MKICNIHNIEKVPYGKKNIKYVCKLCNKEQQAKWWNENKQEQQKQALMAGLRVGMLLVLCCAAAALPGQLRVLHPSSSEASLLWQTMARRSRGMVE